MIGFPANKYTMRKRIATCLNPSKIFHGAKNCIKEWIKSQAISSKYDTKDQKYWISNNYSRSSNDEFVFVSTYDFILDEQDKMSTLLVSKKIIMTEFWFFGFEHICDPTTKLIGFCANKYTMRKKITKCLSPSKIFQCAKNNIKEWMKGKKWVRYSNENKKSSN